MLFADAGHIEGLVRGDAQRRRGPHRPSGVLLRRHSEHPGHRRQTETGTVAQTEGHRREGSLSCELHASPVIRFLRETRESGETTASGAPSPPLPSRTCPRLPSTNTSWPDGPHSARSSCSRSWPSAFRSGETPSASTCRPKRSVLSATPTRRQVQTDCRR